MTHQELTTLIRNIQDELHIPIYLVGGAVRNYLLNIPIKDFDFATPSDPDTIEAAVRLSGRYAHVTLCQPHIVRTILDTKTLLL